MIVDDSKIMRRILKSIIVRAGFDVIAEAENGNEAIEHYKYFKPDLVTMDLTMPKMNGVEATGKIMEFDPDARIIMISAEGEQRLVFEAIRKGAKGYLLKPVHPEKVIKAMKDALPEELVASPKKGKTAKAKKGEDGQKASKAGLGVRVTDGKLPFDIEDFDDLVIVRVSKFLDEENVLLLQEALEHVLDENQLKVVIDLGEIDHLEEAVFDRLTECIKKFKAKKVVVKILSIEASFKDKLERELSKV